MENDQQSLATGHMSERIWTSGQPTDRHTLTGEYCLEGTIGQANARHTLMEN
jgi:hypothetical protein